MFAMDQSAREAARPEVVLLHGMFGCAQNWKGCVGLLRAGWSVRVPEMPVLDLPQENTGVAALVDHLGTLLDRHGVSKAVLGGNSLGGHVALSYALRCPDRVAGLVLVGSSGLFERGIEREVPRRPKPEWIRGKMREVFFDESHVTEDLVERVQGVLSDTGRLRKIVRMAKSAKHENLRDLLPRLRCPILLIWGKDDRITPPEVAHEFKKCLPQAELVFLDRCGHAPNIERPEEVGGLISDFLDRHFGARGGDRGGQGAEAEPPPLIRARALRREFDGGTVRALRGADFAIQEGEFVAVVGPSGCGKSTLLQLLGALDAPTSGEVLFRGRPLSSLPSPEAFRARTVGFIFQSFHLLPTLTALENVQIPMFEMPWGPAERRKRAEALLDAVGLEDRRGHLPAKLSGGERQRVAIARSLANEPVFLLADEPTGNLDSVSAERVLDLLCRLHSERRMALVVVTHDSNVAGRAQRTLRMLDGRIAADSGHGAVQ